MLYEMIGIVRPKSAAEVREIVKSVGSAILRGGGVIRGISNWGVFALARPITLYQVTHRHGHYFVMRYDASPQLHEQLRGTLRLEPRMLRTAHARLGDNKLENLVRFALPKWKTDGCDA